MTNNKLAALIVKLKDYNIKLVHIAYDGSGDSGSITDVEFRDYDGNYVEALKSLTDDFFELGYEILDKHYDFDWYNNDGGYGTIIIDTKDQNVVIDGYVRSIEDAFVEFELSDLKS